MSNQAPPTIDETSLRPDLLESFKLPRASPPNFTDHIFKIVNGLELGIRVWPAENARYPAPFITWHHGGGFIAGSHWAPLPWMEPGLRQRGYHIVSPAYRLGPQATIDDQVEDCIDSITWCRTQLPSILGQDKVDIDRYVICGESAGGALVTLMGHRQLSPPPKAIINVYGAVDLLDPHFGILDKRDSHTATEPWNGEFSEQEIVAALSDHDPTHCLADALSWNEQERCSDREISKLWATDFTFSKPIRLRAEVHIYRSTRLSLASCLHTEGFKDDKEFHAWLRSVSALHLLGDKKTYPPTAFLHGTADSAVPLSQSQKMASKLRSMGVPTVECYESGGPHVFDNVYKSPSVAGWDTYIQPILDFVDKQLSDS
ncbi:Alpha/Beta hydrolase protein [Naematelia encephala]|uniref:Alpha/Beta hydrolase protein n=1 Tax=Naematelia encephala TaxID=71784 RepID=A0A1Y2BE77_9TREE|nr:Alpha/Beta hydrolase protein [Naematelia encephala]